MPLAIKTKIMEKSEREGRLYLCPSVRVKFELLCPILAKNIPTLINTDSDLDLKLNSGLHF